MASPRNSARWRGWPLTTILPLRCSATANCTLLPGRSRRARSGIVRQWRKASARRPGKMKTRPSRPDRLVKSAPASRSSRATPSTSWLSIPIAARRIRRTHSLSRLAPPAETRLGSSHWKRRRRTRAFSLGSCRHRRLLLRRLPPTPRKGARPTTSSHPIRACRPG